MTPVQRVTELGQSLWLDYIRRDLIESGELEELIQKGDIRGVTSNPTIFEQAIADSDLYTAAIRPLAQAKWTADEIFDALAIDDIRAAAGIFLPLYEKTNGRDGFVSIEVNPRFADNASRTLTEARRLWDAVNRPNVMIKIPATKAGISAIEGAIAEGINVNVTLIFSLDRYTEVMKAYLRGLEHRLEKGMSLDHVASVASFFVSRVDTAVDALLETIIREEDQNAERAAALLGKAAISNAKMAYVQFKATFGSPRFERLASHGAQVQRPLWASTSTKNPAYPDTYYVDNLIGPDTVNTLPPKTLEVFRDHGVAEWTLERDLSVARAQLEAYKSINVSLESVTHQLEREGVAKFTRSYTSLLKTLRSRANAAQKELGPLLKDVQTALDDLAEEDVGRRLWGCDPSLWTTASAAGEEIKHRLGWLTLPQDTRVFLNEWEEFREEIKHDGINQVVLLGMGGSSLAADVFRRTLLSDHGIRFQVLDSTNPDGIQRISKGLEINKTLFIVASKSGTTIEPLALMDYFWKKVADHEDQDPGKYFVAITDPGTLLEMIADERGFRRIFSSPEMVGGRYSALSVFGLLPATLMEINTRDLLQGGNRMAEACQPSVEPVRNPGLFLGAVLGVAHRQGRDKVTLLADPGLEPLADWIEQLIAESSGKEGLGLLPIVGEPPGPGKVYSEDRLIVYLREEGTLDRRIGGWIRSQIPVLVLETVRDEKGFGSLFFQWEFATAVACHIIGVNAFDQPDVQRSKQKTVDLIQTYNKRGSLPQPKVLWQDENVTIFGEPRSIYVAQENSLDEVLTAILKLLTVHDALIFLIYLPQERSLTKRIEKVRRIIRDQFGLTTTLGFGPRYLHSTGQLHKGGPDRAVYLMVTTEPGTDFDLPGKEITFGVLHHAQAIGDLQALLGLGRRAYGIHLDSPPRIRDLLDSLQAAVGQLHVEDS
ncbi:MAG: bifunctional transaldolase/phosoglucose isomerase [Anaerolineaceae bacterium]|nr:MAG: bifunctional transaldolase/phosoglucose isomerase [Anaerolineaceae bacterium]